MKNTSLWRACGTNMILAIAVYAGLLGLLWLAETFIPSAQGLLLHFDNTAWCVGIPASIVGVCYILTIKNPDNYTGFYAGILMSLLLGVQCLLQSNYDLAVLFFFICIPFQIKSIVEWKKKSQTAAAKEPFAPSFLSWRGMLLSAAVFAAIAGLDYMQILYVSKTDSGLLLNLLSCFLFSSQIIANFWLIYHKNDTWSYWIIYSATGIVFFAILGNVFSVVLFCFFLVINSLACHSWVRSTPKANYGWLHGE